MGALKNDDFKRKWVQKFAQGVGADFLNAHVFEEGNYVWHVFSFERLPEGSYQHGNRASQAYDNIDKTGALVYFYYEEEELPITQGFSSSAQLFASDCSEIYVYDKALSWCYIRTHECTKGEDYLGPYFMKRSCNSSKPH